MEHGNLQRRLIDAYTEVCRVAPDPRVVSAWSRAISAQTKSMADFIESLTQRSDYRSAVESRYRRLLEEMIGADVSFEAGVFAGFVASHGQSIIRDADIRAHIRKLPAFVQKYEDLAERIAGAVLSDQQRAQVSMAAYVQRLVDGQDGFDLESLHEELSRWAASQPAAPSDESSSQPQPQPQPQTRESTVPDAPPRGDGQPYNLAALSVRLQAFERVYGRKMFVEEYVFHGNALLGDDSAMQATRETFARVFARTRELYIAYADREDFDEHEFVRRYLVEFSTRGEGAFIADLPDRLLQTDEYRAAMTSKLQALVRSMYDENLDDDGVVYLFDMVKARRHGIHDDALLRTLQAFREETDVIVQSVYDVYTTMYGRSPDEEELKRHVIEYRIGIKNGTVAQMAADLTRSLILTLEFQDVVKARMRTRSPSLAHTRLYSLLQRVLSALPQCTDMVSVDELIDRTLLT